jgi:hypothetical protein
VTGVQGGLATLDLGIDPVDQFLAFFHVFTAPDGSTCNPPAIQQLFLRDVAEVR